VSLHITTNILRSAQYHRTSQQIYCGLPSITAYHNKYTAVCPVSLHITTNILRSAQYHCTSQQINCGLPSIIAHHNKYAAVCPVSQHIPHSSPISPCTKDIRATQTVSHVKEYFSCQLSGGLNF